MATKALDQISIMDLTDAYSVILTLDSYTFKGDADSADPGMEHSFTTQVVAMCGSDIVEAVVTPANITPANGAFVYSVDTTSQKTNSGKSPIITITLPAAKANLVTVPGTIRIPVSVANVTIDKDIAYSIAYKGTSGNGITGHSVQYKASNSGTEAPTSWESQVPTLTQGQYLWTKTTLTYSDGTSSVSYSVSRNGTDGSNGGDGRGIASTVVEYAVGTSGTTVPTNGWQTGTVPTVDQGKYLWTRTTVNYTSGDPSVSYSVALQGIDGDDTISVKIISSNGVLFKNNNISTTLTAQVFKGGVQLSTSQINALGTIKWYKNNAAITASNGSQTLVVTGSDVTGSAVFEAKLEG